jgi:hypothetical protein
MALGSKELVLILCSLVLIIYIKYTFSSNPNFDILQVSIQNLNLDILFEKLPVIITERIVDPQEFVKQVFKYTYIYKNVSNNVDPLKWHSVRSRYLLLYNQSDECLLDIAHPREKKKINIAYIQIRMQRNQCCILPTWWMYRCPNNLFTTIKLHSLMTILL